MVEKETKKGADPCKAHSHRYSQGEERVQVVEPKSVQNSETNELTDLRCAFMQTSQSESQVQVSFKYSAIRIYCIEKVWHC